MTKKERTDNAVEILHGRYVKDDAKRQASLEAERVNAEVARLIYDLRKEAGLSQQQLAELINTSQSAISRLEDADYEGHSLSMLNRIAEALRQTLTVVMTAKAPEAEPMRYAFRLCVQLLRREQNLTVQELAKRSDIDPEELVTMERNAAYRPSPRTLHKLSRFYQIPERQMLALAGATKDVPEGLRERASRFAAQSETFAKLTKEEKRALDEFVKVLRAST